MSLVPRVIQVLLLASGSVIGHPAGAAISPDPVVLAEARRAWDVADGQLQRTLAFIAAREPAGLYYPQFTENEALKDTVGVAHGEWILTKVNTTTFWASGALPGMLWLLAGREPDPARRQALEDAARHYATPLLNTTLGDMAMNSLFALRPWYCLTGDPVERQALADSMLLGAALLAQPYDKALDTGRFHGDIGIMGYKRQARLTDNQWYFHAFIDHTVNVEQLLWAARISSNTAEALDWQEKALSHVSVLATTFGANRNPGSAGTWQRSYWDWNEASPTYTQFLFNEAKQGYGHATTWSRGQAWYIYGSSVAYAYSFDAALLPHIKAQVDFYLANLPDRFAGGNRRPGKLVPPWDFDYALSGNPDPLAADHGPQPDTEVDSSAAAMALAGILQLVAALPADDPDRARYLDDAEAILLELCGAEYLCDAADPELSILRHGCYHHSLCVENPGPNKDNGLIWGDYFFVWALWCYLDLTEAREQDLQSLAITPADGGSGGMVARYTRPAGSLPFGYQLEVSSDLTNWQRLPPAAERVTVGYAGFETVEVGATPGEGSLSNPLFVRLQR